MFRCFGLVALCSAILLVSGCKPKGATLIPVSGKVSLDGKPMTEGEVSFGLPGVVPSTMEVKDGAFKGTAQEGKNKVEIRAYRPGTPTVMGDQKFGGEKENYIPDRFNANSTIIAEVKAGASNDFAIEVQSK